MLKLCRKVFSLIMFDRVMLRLLWYLCVYDFSVVICELCRCGFNVWNVCRYLCVIVLCGVMLYRWVKCMLLVFMNWVFNVLCIIGSMCVCYVCEQWWWLLQLVMWYSLKLGVLCSSVVLVCSCCLFLVKLGVLVLWNQILLMIVSSGILNRMVCSYGLVMFSLILLGMVFDVCRLMYLWFRWNNLRKLVKFGLMKCRLCMQFSFLVVKCRWYRWLILLLI